jgi:hypothetical protein
MSKAYAYATVSRAPAKVGKPDVIRVEALNPATDKMDLKGEYIGAKSLQMALEHADRLAETVGRIGV